ncbi:MAG TPA: CBS domain-containing protein [Gemmatimonadaceae bacterium]
MLAREIMTRNLQVVMASDPVWRAAELMRYHSIGCVPVVADDDVRRLVGILTDRDITVRCVARKHGQTCLARDHMTALPLRTVSATDDVSSVLRAMEQHRVRRVPVLGDDGALLGIISEGDLLRRLGRRNPLMVERSLERIFAPASATF